MSKATKDQQVENKEKKKAKVRMKVINKKREEKNGEEKKDGEKERNKKARSTSVRVYGIESYQSHLCLVLYLLQLVHNYPRVIIDISTQGEGQNNQDIALKKKVSRLNASYITV